MVQIKNRGALSMLKLTFPIAMELFFRILVSSADTFMLSSYSNAAVAAVGLVSQYVFFLNLIFAVIGTGCSIVLAQYIGAGKSKEELNHIAQASAIMVSIISLVLTFAVIFGTRPLLNCYELEDSVREYAWQYFIIYGGICCFFNAFSLLQGAILRSYGYTNEAMIVSLVANFINVVGNALSLYGWFGLPVFGVKGVAWASGISMIASCILFNFFIRRRKDVELHIHGITKVPLQSYKLVLSVGVPTAGESLSYNVSQIVIMAMVSTLGTNAISAEVYTMTIVRFVFSVASAVGQATQIKTGYYVGARQSDVAYKKVFKYQLIATVCSMVMIVVVNIAKNPVIRMFTDIEEVYSMVTTLLILSVYIEFGRSLNLIYVGALKGAGDVKFPVLYGIISMWGIMVFGSYILGLKMGLGLAGFWIGIGTDETTRGIVMLLRWKSKRWQKYALV
ncbi:MATE family efflux transporter [Treponema sp. Marseille-Q3903]|uniref:MATE family efflux transporter n=1 Tax=Treponema sp. Marseille-Q3903 TaxID=2766703 RepID=UPI0016522A44|nr:MATE family efflux transporter [Treponema sp. Marseille-Q3903]MBC6712580.1 MATE family efflux transporter [Treponema sp. Marseille-Q3903]